MARTGRARDAAIVSRRREILDARVAGDVFAPFIAHGWRFIGEGARAATYGATTLVPPGCEATLLGENASFMVPGEHWSPETTDEGARLVFKACGFLFEKGLSGGQAAGEASESSSRRVERFGRDASARHDDGVGGDAVSATVYRHKRWSFECFREMYRNHRALKDAAFIAPRLVSWAWMRSRS